MERNSSRDSGGTLFCCVLLRVFLVGACLLWREEALTVRSVPGVSCTHALVMKCIKVLNSFPD